MKKILLVLVLISGVFSMSAYADTQNSNNKNQRCQLLINKKTISDINFLNQCQNKKLIVKSRQGCCSWHKGVCGCSNGRIVCCDGVFSPSCRC